MSPIVAVSIVPDSDTVELYDQMYASHGETYILRGHIDLQLSQPVPIRQIKVVFKGRAKSVESIHSRSSSTDLATSGVLLLNEKYYVLSEPIVPRIGVTRWPFEITIRDAQLLIPSLSIPNHSISYEISAHVTLYALRDKVRFNYWNTCMESLRFPCKKDISHKRTRLRVKRPIRVHKYTFGSLDCLEYCCPRTRYQGVRNGRIRYEVSVPKFVCLQSRRFEFNGSFLPLCNAARVTKVEITIDQIEKHPIRTSIFTTNRHAPSKLTWMTRVQKTCHKCIDVGLNELTDFMRFSVDLEVLQLGQDIDSEHFKMTHSLHMMVHFAGLQERAMSLRFPIQVGTVPMPRNTQEALVVRINDSSFVDETALLDELLPSYHDVLSEGTPPSPFLAVI